MGGKQATGKLSQSSLWVRTDTRVLDQRRNFQALVPGKGICELVGRWTPLRPSPGAVHNQATQTAWQGQAPVSLPLPLPLISAVSTPSP